MKTWTNVCVWFKHHWHLPITLLAVVLVYVLSRLAGIRMNALPGAGDILLEHKQKADAEIAVIRQREEEKIKTVEADYREKIQDLSDSQQEEYKRVRERGPRAVANYLNDFDRRMR